MRNQKSDNSKENELDLLGDEEVESFTRSQADLEGATDNSFASPPHPQTLHAELLSFKTLANAVPPTPRQIPVFQKNV